MLGRKSEDDEIRIADGLLIGRAEVIVALQLDARKIVLVFHVSFHAGEMLLVYVENVDPAALCRNDRGEGCSEAAASDECYCLHISIPL